MYKRTAYLKEIEVFLGPQKSEKIKSGLTYVRGRRRVGKSTLLQAAAKSKNIFYFTGIQDESMGQQKKDLSRNGLSFQERIHYCKLVWNI